MMMQYIVVALIGLLCLGLVLRALYRLIKPSEEAKTSCQGCHACNTNKKNTHI